MKVCFFLLNRLDFEGGAEKYVVEMATELRKKGHQVSIVCYSNLFVNILPRFENIIFKIVGSDLHNESFKDRKSVNRSLVGINVYRLSARAEFPLTLERKKIKEIINDSDVIYCKNEFFDTTYLRYFFGRKNFQKTVLGVHTAIFLPNSKTFFNRVHNFLYFSGLYQRYLKLCGAVHVVNSFYVKSLPKVYQIDSSKVILIFYGLPEKNFSNNHNSPNSIFTILFAGRFTEQKGINYLISFIVKISKRPEFNKIKIIIAGTGPLESFVKDLPQRFKNVIYLGFEKDMKSLYSKVDLSIVFSKWEMLPYNCLEPQASGVPVVAFKIPGTEDIIIQSETGKLVPLGNVTRFESEVLSLYKLKFNHPEKYNEMRKKSYLFARKRFSMETISNKWKDLFLVALRNINAR